ncbi:histone-lysine N-methyltransferase SETMAR-like [Lepeophtheirus salmonis]|uniref:histone-lysine N-methyltransferase SETMAR-like n=1 Tax=Lepeophtheirus salmonis TaxID=72036 RepID=UPI001AEABD5C|nr:histone-lysine N-methyltransferase SETMAR-like [Lepeophtheirus salmonis]
MFKQNKKKFLRRYFTTDKTWMHHFTPESKQESVEWCGNGESRPKTQTSAAKVMASKNNQQLLYWFLELVKGRNYPEKASFDEEKGVFHQGNNALCHKSIKTATKLVELGIEVLPHLPYSSNLGPSDYWPFVELKKMLRGKRFVSDEEVIVEMKHIMKVSINHYTAVISKS